MLAFVVIDFSYLLFHTYFARGVKVRLFCSPQWMCATLSENLISTKSFQSWWLLPLPNEDFGRPNQQFRMRFRSTFRPDSWPESGTHTLEKCFENAFWFNFSPPKRRFWAVGRTFQNAFSKHFSRAWVLDLGYKSLKSASKTHSETLVRPSKIFVWGA